MDRSIDERIEQTVSQMLDGRRIGGKCFYSRRAVRNWGMSLSISPLATNSQTVACIVTILDTDSKWNTIWQMYGFVNAVGAASSSQTQRNSIQEPTRCC